MCGISGIWSPSRYSPEELSTFAIDMANRLHHRGPDTGGNWISRSGRTALAHRRLKIIDTSHGGHQPMVSPDGRYALTFNGEIYNYKELRIELQRAGIRFSTDSDTEVLLMALIHFGDGVFEHLDGMYAFCLVDQLAQTLLIARDPFGEKPLYYTEHNGILAFASEISALQILPFFDSTLDDRAIQQFFLLQYILAPQTIFKETKKLAPGTSLFISTRGHILRTYFRYEPDGRNATRRNLDDAVDELDVILRKSVRRRLISDVPLGAFLSGGVDSSLICAMAREMSKTELKTFSIGFKGSAASEHRESAATARYLGTTHRELLLHSDDVNDRLNDVIEALDEPNADTSCLPTLAISKFAKADVTVALSGDGGDELFAGYNRNRTTLKEEEEARSNSAIEESWNAGSAYISSRFLLFDKAAISALFRDRPEFAIAEIERMQMAINNNPEIPLVSRLRRFDLETFLPGAVLSKVDRMSMRYALEVRSPFLNVELARFSESLHPEHCFSNNTGKIILRRLADRYFPKAWLDRPKKGFGIPAREWSRAPLLNEFRRIISMPSPLCLNWISREGLEQIYSSFEADLDAWPDQMWSIVVFEKWLEKHQESVLNYGTKSALQMKPVSSPVLPHFL